MGRFSQRSQSKEMMDLPGFTIGEYRRCLQDISRFSFWTSQHRQILKEIKEVLAKGSYSVGQPLRILEVGFGSGDLIRRIINLSPVIHVTGVDLHPWAEEIANETLAGSPVDQYSLYTRDAVLFEPKEKPHLIVSSLLAHHLTDCELVNYIEWMNESSEIGWLINDIRRHPIAYWGAQVLAKILNVCPMVKNDAPLSVCRALTANEWRRLLKQTSLGERASVEPVFPFKVNVVQHGNEVHCG